MSFKSSGSRFDHLLDVHCRDKTGYEPTGEFGRYSGMLAVPSMVLCIRWRTRRLVPAGDKEERCCTVTGRER